MTAGRQFGSSITSVSGGTGRHAAATIASAIGSSTSPSVPTWNARGPVARAARAVADGAAAADVPSSVEPYAATPSVVQLGDRQRRRRSVVAVDRQVDPVRVEARREPPAEPVASTGGRGTRPRHPSRPIVRAVLNGPATGRSRVTRPVGPDEEVDEGLAGDDDHARHAYAARRTLPAVDRRTDALELLDGPLDDPAALAGNLRDLRRVNRWLGGARLSAAAIDALAAHRPRARPCSTSGPAAPTSRSRSSARRQRGPAPGRRRARQPAGGPRRGRPRPAGGSRRPPASSSHVGDGRSLPYPDRSFDVAHASLVLHHLEPGEAVGCSARWAASRGSGVVVNDLDGPARAGSAPG